MNADGSRGAESVQEVPTITLARYAEYLGRECKYYMILMAPPLLDFVNVQPSSEGMRYPNAQHMEHRHSR